MQNIELLKKLCEASSISGREENIRALLTAEFRRITDEVSVDAMGNLIAQKRGHGGPSVLVAAHMDEIGFFVRYIDDNGFIRLQPVGGFDARVLVAQRVHVHGFNGKRLLGVLMPATKPVHMFLAEDVNKAVRIDNLFVDLGLPVEDVKKNVELGDMVTLERTMEVIGDKVVGKSLDNRVGIFVMLEALKMARDHKCDVIAVATVQEEVGMRGAKTAAYILKPDIAIALDGTLANDFPGPEASEYITRLGVGCAIKIMDESLICNLKLVRHFRDIAQTHEIPHQIEVLPSGKTDAGGMERTRVGVPSFTLSVPMRYAHTVNEMCDQRDITAAITLLAKFLEEAHLRNYVYTIA
jgi:tetrahedral aminopeptidase